MRDRLAHWCGTCGDCLRRPAYLGYFACGNGGLLIALEALGDADRRRFGHFGATGQLGRCRHLLHLGQVDTLADAAPAYVGVGERRNALQRCETQGQ